MRRFLAVLFATWFSVFAWTVGFARAAVVTAGRISPATLQTSTLSNQQFVFTTSTGVAEGQTVTLAFDTPFDTSTIVENDVDVLDDGVSKTTAADCTGSEQMSVAMVADVLTLVVCVGDGGAIGAASQVTVRIGTTAVDSGVGVNRITNPSAAAVHFVTLGGTFGDFGAFAFAIGGDDTVVVSTTVTTGTGSPPPPGGGGGCPPTCPPPPPSETIPPVISDVTITGITATAATVNFTTNEAASGKVQYGVTTDYGSEVSSGTYLQTHSWPLSGLSEGTTYHFHIIATDTVGNVGTSADFTFTTLDLTPPVISSIAATGLTQSGATVTWTTNEAADSTVEYGLTDAYGSTATLAEYETAHSVPLSALAAGTTYHYRVKSADTSGNITTSADDTFTTVADLPPGNVTGLTLTPGNGAVAVAWTNPTDVDLQSIRVLLCTDAPPASATDATGCVVASEVLESAHSYIGLTNGSTYYFGVFAKDAAGQFASGTLGSVIPVGPDVPPANVSNFRAATGNGRLTLSWTNPSDLDLAGVRLLACTDVLPSSPSDVEGCTVIFDGSGTSFVYSGLTNGTPYYFGIYARDAAGQFSTGAFATGTPSNIDEAPPAVSNLLGRAGDTRVTLSWDNPAIGDLATVRVIACPTGFPSAPSDISGGCTVVSEATADTFVHSGLTNGKTYFYGVYVRDAAGQYSPGAFRSVTPSAQFAECGDNSCNGEETPISCPADCGPVQAVCGNAVCETGETSVSCPADCGLIPACGNGVCDPDETALMCPADCIALPPTTEERLIGLQNIDVFVQGGTLQLHPSGGGFDFLAGKEVLVRISETQLPKPVERAQITMGPQTFNFARQTLKDGTVVYQAQLPIPPNAGSFATAIELFYQDGKTQTLSWVSRVQGYGVVYELKDGLKLPLSQAVVTLLEGASGNKAWDASLFGQENPRVTGSVGTYGWYVPNGTYHLRVEKAGYRIESVGIEVKNNVVGLDVRLHLDQPLIPTVLEAVQDLRADPNVQQAADVTTPAVVAVVVANTAALAVGFNLLAYLRYLTTAPVLLFSRRKRKGYGVVYNAITKVPVDLAIVRLFRINEAQPEAMGQLVSSRVTDKGGRYFFLAQPGVYRLTASKPNFTYPSKYLGNVKDDGLFLDVYHTEPIRVTGSSASIAANIPLDPVEAAVTPKSVIWRKRFRTFQNVVAILGNVGAIGVLVLYPSVFTAAMAGVQLVMYALIRRLASPKKPVNWGIVYDTQTGRPLSNVIARIFEPKYNKLLETAMTDSRGRFTFLLGPNEYYAVFEKAGFESHVIRPIDYTKKTEPSELAAKVSLSPSTTTGTTAPIPAVDLLPPPTSAPPEPTPIVPPNVPPSAPPVAVAPVIPETIPLIEPNVPPKPAMAPSEVFAAMPEPPPVTSAPHKSPENPPGA